MRTLPATVQSAIGQASTQPVYLIQMGFSSVARAATWADNIDWNGETWISSGIEVGNLNATNVNIKFPNGDDDAWLALFLNEGIRGVSIDIYEHHTDTTASPTTDAVQVFSGVMDELSIQDQTLTVKVIESAKFKAFPPYSIDQPTFTFLPDSGTVIAWGTDQIEVR